MSEELARLAAAAAQAGARTLVRRFRDRSLVAESKAEHDLVSAADRESEAAIISFLQGRLPDHAVLSEEAGLLGSSGSEYRWIIDPLDGTNNFLQGLPIWAVSVACSRGGEIVAGAIFDPPGDNLFVATRGGGARWNDQPMRVSEHPRLHGAFLATGFPFRARGAIDIYLSLFRGLFLQAKSIRRCGAAALDLAYTAAGIYDGFFEFRLSSWDLAAGVLMIEEAGGVVSDLDGAAGYLTSGNLLAGPAAVHAELLAEARKYANESVMNEREPVGGSG